MAWVETPITVAGAIVAGHVRRTDCRIEAVIPWRAGVGPGVEIVLDDGRYTVSATRDPGGRHEVLELTLEPAGPATVPSVHGSFETAKRRKGTRPKEAK